MAVQPLNKTKIIKKKTNKIRRYQSDEFGRVKVRNQPSCVQNAPWALANHVGFPKHGATDFSDTICFIFANVAFLLYRDHGESREVLIHVSEDASEARLESPRSVPSRTRRPDTSSSLASRSSSSETKRTSNSSWWTTASTPVRSPSASPPKPGKISYPHHLVLFLSAFV